MGTYIKSPDDVKICAMLTKRFSDAVIPASDPAYDPANPQQTYIEQMRRHHSLENMFDGAHSLDRVSHRLSSSLGHGDTPSTKKARLRWYWLLNLDSKILPVQTRLAICSVLDQVLSAGSAVNYVTFDAQVAPAIANTYELHPSNSTTPQVIAQGGKQVCLMMLDCQQDSQLPNPSTKLGAKGQSDPPPKDKNEVPINNVPVTVPSKAKKKTKTKQRSGRKSARRRR